MKRSHLVLVPAFTAILCGFLFYAGGTLSAFATAFGSDIPLPVVPLVWFYPAAPFVAAASVGLSFLVLGAGDRAAALLRANWVLLFLIAFMSAYALLGMTLSRVIGAGD